MNLRRLQRLIKNVFHYTTEHFKTGKNLNVSPIWTGSTRTHHLLDQSEIRIPGQKFSSRTSFALRPLKTMRVQSHVFTVTYVQTKDQPG